MLPPRSVTNMRSWAGSSAIPMPSIRWVATISGSALPMSSRGARLTVLPCGVVDFQVDRLRQVLEHHLDVAASCSGFAGGKVEPGTQNAAEPGIAWAFLRPVEVPAGMVDRDADAPPGLVSAVLLT